MNNIKRKIVSTEHIVQEPKSEYDEWLEDDDRERARDMAYYMRGGG